jgi:hypothetical protein
MTGRNSALVLSQKSPALNSPLCKAWARGSGAIVGRDRLTWRRESGLLCLYYRLHHGAIVTVEPDRTYPGLFRVRLPDGDLSEILNLSRAKDAAIAAVLHHLNSTVQETGTGSRLVRLLRSAVNTIPSVESRLPSLPSMALAESGL